MNKSYNILLYRSCPHSRSLILNTNDIIKANKLGVRDRYINFNAIELLKYEDYTNEYVSSYHYGQRKLLISEIEFLTKYSNMARNILYIGAAPGTHIPMLSMLFRNNKFILYDPLKFSIKPDECITIVNNKFTIDDIQKFKDISDDLIIISDLRTNTDDNSIINDNIFQKKVVKEINPVAASLKFRIPYDKGRPSDINFIDGEYHIQSWSKEFSSETRLFCNRPYKDFNINVEFYENYMYTHNKLVRPSIYETNLVYRNPYMDKCYDCTSESFILEEYTKKYNPDISVSDINKAITYDLCVK